jgi:hypothetical protein
MIWLISYQVSVIWKHTGTMSAIYWKHVFFYQLAIQIGDNNKIHAYISSFYSQIYRGKLQNQKKNEENRLYALEKIILYIGNSKA